MLDTSAAGSPTPIAAAGISSMVAFAVVDVRIAGYVITYVRTLESAEARKACTTASDGVLGMNLLLVMAKAYANSAQGYL